MKNIKSQEVTIIIFFLFVISPYLLPYYLRKEILPTIIKDFLNLISIGLMFFFIAKYLLIIRHFFSKLLLLIMMYTLMIYTSLMNNGEVLTATIRMIQIILICATVSIVSLKSNKFGIYFLYAVKYYTLAFCIINIILMFIYPSGIPSYTYGKIAPYFLYSNVNATIKFIFPGMLCSSLIDYKRKYISFGTFMLWFCIIYQFLFIYHTATALIACSFITLWMLLKSYILKRIKEVYFVFLVIILLFEISIFLGQNSYVIKFITDLFNKNSDLSGRVILWKQVIECIKFSPLWGYGLQSSELVRFNIGNPNGSHNHYLDIVYCQGIIGLSIFLYFIIIPFIKVGNNISHTLYVIFGYCIGYLIMFISEPFYGFEVTYFPVFFCCIVLCYVDNINKTTKKLL